MCLSLGKRGTGRRNVHVVNRKRNGPAISAQHLYPLMENCSTRFRWRFWQFEKYNLIILRQIEKFFIPLPVVVSVSYQEKVLYEGRWPTFFRRQQEQLLQHPLLSPLFKLSIIFLNTTETTIQPSLLSQLFKLSWNFSCKRYRIRQTTSYALHCWMSCHASSV